MTSQEISNQPWRHYKVVSPLSMDSQIIEITPYVNHRTVINIHLYKIITIRDKSGNIQTVTEIQHCYSTVFTANMTSPLTVGGFSQILLLNSFNRKLCICDNITSNRIHIVFVIISCKSTIHTGRQLCTLL